MTRSAAALDADNLPRQPDELEPKVAQLGERLRTYGEKAPSFGFFKPARSTVDLARSLRSLTDDDNFSATELRRLMRQEDYESLFRLPPQIIAEALGLDRSTPKEVLQQLRELWFSTSSPESITVRGYGKAAVEVMWAVVSNWPASLASLDLSNNGIGQEGAVPLILLLRKSNLAVLDLSENSLFRGFNNAYNANYVDDVAHFSEALANNRALRALDLSNNFIDIRSRSIVRGLAEGLTGNQTLRSLNLSGCGLDLGASSNFAVLAKALGDNATLQELDLSNNNIDRSGADALIRALEKNKTIIKLDISGNDDIHAEQFEEITKLLARNQAENIVKADEAPVAAARPSGPAPAA